MILVRYSKDHNYYHWRGIALSKLSLLTNIIFSQNELPLSFTLTFALWIYNLGQQIWHSAFYVKRGLVLRRLARDHGGPRGQRHKGRLHFLRVFSPPVIPCETPGYEQQRMILS